ncbi:MAG: gliding motility lipoprotein GldH [Microscillaceae bacterium]|nr:gliding motility lipoprotein GldH [Microscillaceae bacterium]
MQFAQKIFFYLIIIGISACKSGNYYQKYEDIKLLDWKASKPTTFAVEIKETNPPLAIVAGFRYLPMIRHQALKFKLSIQSPSGKSVEQDYTVPIRNAQGEHLGSTMGEMTDLEQAINTSYQFLETGTYKFTLTQAMGEEDIAGIIEVGLILRKKK